FEADTSRLWTLDSAGNAVQTPSAMQANDPSIAGLSDGSFQIAFVASDGTLWTQNSASGGFQVTTQFVPGGPPAIAADAKNGGWMLAVQATNTREWLYDSAGHLTQTLSALASGTTPAIAALSTGGYVQAFVASNGVLWTEGTDRFGHSTFQSVDPG